MTPLRRFFSPELVDAETLRTVHAERLRARTFSVLVKRLWASHARDG